MAMENDAMSEDAKRALSDDFRQALILAGMEAGEAAARAALILKDYSLVHKCYNLLLCIIKIFCTRIKKSRTLTEKLKYFF